MRLVVACSAKEVCDPDQVSPWAEGVQQFEEVELLCQPQKVVVVRAEAVGAMDIRSADEVEGDGFKV